MAFIIIVMIVGVVMVLGLIPAIIAENKGRNFLLWYIYGAALFILAFVHSTELKPFAGGSAECPHCARCTKREPLPKDRSAAHGRSGGSVRV
ncbi:MAG: putative phage-like rane protein [Caulobacteraceae bacterium]|nr:putative phage-like rane protein [Caulobacteraceae bacterium]